MKGSWNAATLFFNILGVLSVLLLFDHATHFGWVSVVEVTLSYYEFIKDFILAPIKPIAQSLAEAVSSMLHYELKLLDHWSDVFVLVTLYLAARTRSYWNAGIRRRAGFRAIWGVIIGFLTGVVAGVSEPSGIAGNLYIIIAVVLGLAVFDIVDAAWSATFHRKTGLTWLQDWVRYAAFSMPSILIGVVFTLVTYLTYSFWSPSWIDVPGIIAVLAFSVALAFYWLYRGLRSSQSSEKQGTGFEKFVSSSNSQIGILMLRSLGGAAIVMAFSAGWSLVQP